MSDSSTKGGAPPTLIVTGGPRDGAMITLKPVAAGILLGSGPTCHLRLELGNIDLVHARVVWDARGISVTDVGSAMGTYVNGEKIAADHPLADGDRVCLGPPGSKGSAKLLVRIPVGASVMAPPEPFPSEGEPLRFNVDEGEKFVLEAPHENPATAWSPGAASESEPQIVTDAHAELPPTNPDGGAAQAASADAVPPPLPGAPPTTVDERKPARPDYVGVPSIWGERERETIALPPAEPLPRRARRAFTLPARKLPKEAVAALVALAVLVAGAFLYRALQKPPPMVTAIVPPKAEPGQTVTIRGTGFHRSASRNTVRFGEEIAQVTSGTETQLACVVPAALLTAGSADYPVTVEARGDRSNTLSFRAYRGPRLEKLEPDVALPGQEIVLRGQNLSGSALLVLVGGVSAEVKDAQADALRVTVPPLPLEEGRVVNVTVQVGTEQARAVDLVLGHLPVVTHVEPGRGPAGERAIIHGRGFDPDPKANTVTFGAARALVIGAAPAELTVSVPAVPAPTSPVQATVGVQVGGKRTASRVSFLIVRPSSGVFQPRFFAAPVSEHPSHDHAFVSTELGPFLLLTGAAEAPSTAERAVKAAAALNAVFAAADAGPVKLEAREGGVGLAGQGDLLVAATAADADGYGEGWDPSFRGRKLSPRAVATYWTALIEDYLALFVQRQRPMQVLELSSRARVLSEIYTESARAAGSGAGVPVSLLRPLSSSWAKGVRDLALLLPAEGSGRGAAAVEGVWEGTIEEEGQGSRTVRVRFRLEPSGLRGFLTTRSGGVALEVSLSDVTYERGGALRFTLTTGGSPRQFRARLDGENLSGTIHEVGTGRESGRFALRFVE